MFLTRLRFISFTLLMLLPLGSGMSFQQAYAQDKNTGINTDTSTNTSTNTPASPHVVLAGVMNDKAVIIIGNAAPRTLSVGQEVQGVKLLSIQGKSATVSITAHGQTSKITLRVGQAPITQTYTQAEQPRTPNTPARQTSCVTIKTVTIPAHRRMFFTKGYINNQEVNFIIDTGATNVSMSEKQAIALGITGFKRGTPVRMSTANGTSMAYEITLASVRVGRLEVKNVAATVGGDKSEILLGNSFLTHLDIEMSPDQLVLKERCP